MNGLSALDIMVSELQQNAEPELMLRESMTLNPEKVSRIPIRYRIIALGFAKQYSLAELNEKLLSRGCAKLYARSLWEASLIYAFQNRIRYPEWKELYALCCSLIESKSVEEQFFRNRTIRMQDLEEYLTANSDEFRLALSTGHLTQSIQKRLLEMASEQGGFERFLEENIRSFSLTREKSRFYFCKYLYYDLLTKIDEFLEAREKGAALDEAYSLLSMFKGVQTLKRKKMTAEEARAFLMQTDISCGGIFDAFNYHYFEYVSLDWLDVLIEYCGCLASLPEKQKHRLAESIRKTEPKTYGGMNDTEILRLKQAEAEKRELETDDAYALEGPERGYQRNRSGENAIRRYIKGELDIDRTTLICFLLFFGEDARLPSNEEISEDRLNAILRSCGFPGLRPEDEFDSFVLGYLEEDNPVDFLMEEVTNRALEKENFYLYRVYNLSTSYHEDFRKVTRDPRENRK